LKFLFVYAWGWLADASVCAHQQLGHQEQLDQQQNDRSTPTRWNQSGQERIGSTEDTPSPSASSPSGAFRIIVEASIFDASSSPLNTSTTV
jgi:hypothetical protein